MSAQASRPHDDVLDVFVSLLSDTDTEVHSAAPSSAFYNRLCEAVCHLTSLERAALFLYDDVRRRVRAVGMHGIDTATAVAIDASLDDAPLAQQALSQDRVIEAVGNLEEVLPAQYVRALGLTRIACIPLAAGDRWLGVLFGDCGSGPLALEEEERSLLWSLGKTAALAACARIATREQEQARRLRDRLTLAREIHDSVVQRLFGLSAVLRTDGELTAAQRERCSSEIETALADLREAIKRPLAARSPETDTTLWEELQHLRGGGDPAPVELSWQPGLVVPAPLEPLAQSVLREAVRNIRKHARPTAVEIEVTGAAGAFLMEVRNDGVGDVAGAPGVGLRLAALEAIDHGGIVEFGGFGDGRWRVRLLVPGAV